MNYLYWAEQRRKIKEMWRKDFLTPGWRDDPLLIADVVERLMEDLHEKERRQPRISKHGNSIDVGRRGKMPQ